MKHMAKKKNLAALLLLCGIPGWLAAQSATPQKPSTPPTSASKPTTTRRPDFPPASLVMNGFSQVTPVGENKTGENTIRVPANYTNESLALPDFATKGCR